ncbi:MAG: type 4a pilus biogenesis protein PilO [Planctomycetes bacterium]|nr:type 4a pilus biogenesis protein PilO [Planctomycetota bacterium]
MTKQSDDVFRVDIAGGLFCVAVTGVAYFTAIAPNATRREEQVRQQAEILELRTQLDQTTKFQRQLTAQLAARHSDLEKTAIQLEPATSVNQRVSSLTTLAAQVGIVLDAVEPGSQNDASDFSRVPIKLSGKGTYAASATFLSQLKERFPDTAVSSMRLNSNPAAPSSVPTVWFDLVWYAAPAGGSTITSIPEK